HGVLRQFAVAVVLERAVRLRAGRAGQGLVLVPVVRGRAADDLLRAVADGVVAEAAGAQSTHAGQAIEVVVAEGLVEAGPRVRDARDVARAVVPVGDVQDAGRAVPGLAIAVVVRQHVRDRVAGRELGDRARGVIVEAAGQRRHRVEARHGRDAPFGVVRVTDLQGRRVHDARQV